VTTDPANVQTTETKTNTPDPAIAASQAALKELQEKLAATEAKVAAAEAKAQQAGRVQELLNTYSNSTDRTAQMQAGRELLRLQGVGDEEAAKVMAEQFGTQGKEREVDEGDDLAARLDMTANDITKMRTDLLKTRINDMITEKALAATGASGTLLNKITKIKGDKSSEQARSLLVEAIRRETVAKLRQLSESGTQVSLDDVNAVVTQADRKAAESFGAFFHESANLGSAPAPVPDWIKQVKEAKAPVLPKEGTALSISDAEDVAEAWTNNKLLSALADMESDTGTKA